MVLTGVDIWHRYGLMVLSGADSHIQFILIFKTHKKTSQKQNKTKTIKLQKNINVQYNFVLSEK